MSRPLSREQRLLRYYRDCVAAEGRHDLTSSPTNPAIALLTDGAEPVVTRPSGCAPIELGSHAGRALDPDADDVV